MGDNLPRMAYMLDSEMQSRLVKHYQQVSDQELIDAATRRDDLTPMAQEVVRAELKNRGLERAWPGNNAGPIAPTPADWPSDPFGLAQNGSFSKPEFGAPIEKGKTVLITFSDAIDAGRACGLLDESGIALEIRDLSQTEGQSSFYGGSPIALQLIVAERDRDQAVRLLREKMGLFPLENIAEPDALEDDGTVATVGQFAQRSDAEEIARVLTDAKIWNRITANPDGSAATEDAFLVEVREVDLVDAGELVEKALDLPEV